MPDIASAVRELSKVNNRAKYAHHEQMLRAVKYDLHTRNRMLKFIPEKSGEKWEVKCIYDSDYAEDKNNMLSVTGYCVYPFSWKSRAQRSRTISSTEAEYVALSEIWTEILFVRMVMEFLGQPVEYPLNVYFDNVVPIYLAYKDVDTSTHFVRSYEEMERSKLFSYGRKKTMQIFFRRIDRILRTYNKFAEKFITQNPN